ncbi:MAG: hypothetical protein ACI8Z5_002031 [Lentimonas sp.]|jgi:hypothetical protein
MVSQSILNQKILCSSGYAHMGEAETSPEYSKVRKEVNMSDTNPNYPSTTENPSGGGRGNTPKGK